MQASGGDRLGYAIPFFGLIRCLTEFTAGTVIGALWLRARRQPARPFAAAVLLSSGGFALFGSGLINELWAIPAALAALLLAVALTANRPGNPLAWGPVHYLGEISFATYLSHSLLWKAFKMAFVSDATSLSLVQIALLLLTIFVASIALYRWIERPAQRWINGLPSRRHSRERSPA